MICYRFRRLNGDRIWHLPQPEVWAVVAVQLHDTAKVTVDVLHAECHQELRGWVLTGSAPDPI